MGRGHPKCQDSALLGLFLYRSVCCSDISPQRQGTPLKSTVRVGDPVPEFAPEISGSCHLTARHLTLSMCTVVIKTFSQLTGNGGTWETGNTAACFHGLM